MDGASAAEQDMNERKACPRCGLPLAKDYSDKPSAEDRKNYIRAVLGGKRFQKEFTFFDGALKVMFQEMTGGESKKLFAAISELESDSNLMPKAVRMKMGLCTVYVDKGGQRADTLNAEVTRESLEAAYDKAYGSLPESVVATVHGAFAAFNSIVGKIGESCLDKNF
jgi:hypothetical protein